MSDALVALGANLGDRERTLRRAAARLKTLPATRLKAQSRWRATAPVGGPAGQGEFLNGAARLETSLAPMALLDHLQRIERELGRARGAHWAARALDLDLLLYDERIIRGPRLTVPHPRMAYRRFVLEPAVEIAADMRHPEIGWTLEQLWRHLNGPLDYIAVTGPLGVGKTSLAERLQRRFGGELLREPIADADLARYYADPSGRGLATELKFLDVRAEQLAGSAWSGENAPLLISDYWFGQPLAFARWCLDAADQATVRARYEERLPRVIRPKLIVALDAPAEQLLQRIADRGRPYEQSISLERLEALRLALAALLDEPGRGPLLRIDTRQTNPTAEEEAAAAVAALRA